MLRRGRHPGDLLAVAFAVYAVLFIAWVASRVGSGDQRELLSDAAFLPVNLAATWLAWKAAGRADLDVATRRAWKRLAFAFAAWWVGDALWFGMEVIAGEAPFPSVADIGYLAFYPLLLWGLLSFPAGPRTRADRRKVWLDAATVTLGGLMIVWYLVVGPTLSTSGGAGLIVSILSVAYPVGDLLLVFGVAALLLRGAGRRDVGALRVLLTGVLCFVIADLAYAHLTLQDAYRGGDWPDAFWMAAQVLLVLSAQCQFRRAPGVEPEVPVATAGTGVSRLPYLAIAVGYGLLLAVGSQQAGFELGGLILGAGALTALVVSRQIAVTAENVRLLVELQRLATTDVLTGVKNRGAFLAAADQLFGRGRVTGRPVAALMIDVDHFKTINDTHGHATGDAVLSAVAEACRAQLRGSDLIGRYGGDELVVFLPDTSLEDGLRVAERMAERLAAAPMVTESGVARVTLSIGVAEGGDAADVAELLAQADRGLYQAKRAGRACARPYLAA
ncbi:MAG: GGDEF domain-containing protein [Acidimicrobiia bacterium]